MDRMAQQGASPARRELFLREGNQAFDQYEQLHSKIARLLKASSDAKEKGQWKKAQDILLEIRKLTKDNTTMRT